MPSKTAFRVYEEYVEGAIRIDDGNSLILTFWTQPPSEWNTKYSANIERIKKDKVFYSVIITDEAKLEEFIKDEMPAFEEYINIARQQYRKEKREIVLRLAKQLLFDTKTQRQARLSKFKEELQR